MQKFFRCSEIFESKKQIFRYVVVVIAWRGAPGDRLAPPLPAPVRQRGARLFADERARTRGPPPPAGAAHRGAAAAELAAMAAALEAEREVKRDDGSVLTDADGTYPNERIPELVEGLQKNDMLIGARIGKNVRIPLLRRPVKWLLLKSQHY